MSLLPQGKNREPLHLPISDNTAPLRLSQIEAVRWIGGLKVLSEKRWVTAPDVAVCQVWVWFLSVSEKDDGLNLCVSRNVTGRPPMKEFLIRARWKQNGTVIPVTQKTNCAPPKDTSSNDCCWNAQLDRLHFTAVASLCSTPPPALPPPPPNSHSLLNMNKSSLWQQMCAADTLLTSP